MFHTTRNQLITDPDASDHKTTVDITYDGEGLAKTKTNPYRSTPSTTDGTTTYYFDAMGRAIETAEQDGSLIQMCYDGVVSTPAVSYCPSTPQGSMTNGSRVDTTDESGNHWERVSDAFGNLTEVMEPNGTSQTPTMETDYTYNTLNDLTRVDQWGGAHGTSGEIVRTFSYDPLARLVTAQNPETGAITYAYLASGALCAGDITLPCSKTDARNVITNYGYDSTNRLTGKTYQPPSPLPLGYAATASVSYFYDAGSSGFTKGHRTSMTDSAGSESWTYDSMGRIASINRSVVTLVSTQTNPAAYTYNQGGLLSVGHFFALGTTFQYTYGGAGRALSLNQNGDVNWTFANNAQYAPTGQLTSVTLGGANASTTKIAITNAYNNRLQPTSLNAATAVSPIIPLYNHTLNYAAAPANNGNILTDLDGLNSVTASYTYDTLNRLKTAQSPAGGQVPAWGDSYTYDPFGNLYQKTGLGSGYHETLMAGTNGQNQLTIVQNGQNVLTYDAAGNVLTDNMIPSTQYTWDAESRMASSTGLGGSATYSYDGDGNRVLKYDTGISSLGSIFWYGPDGSLTDETTVAMNGSNPRDLQRNFYFAGKLIAREGFPTSFYPTYLLLSDQVGTSRVSVDSRWSSGNPTQYAPTTATYYPFGGYVGAAPGDTTLDQRFTGKVRDTETGVDYLGARYLTGSLSRMMSPDPFIPFNLKKENFQSWMANPQHWNKYSYVLNNPLRFTDPTGMTETIYYFLSSNLTEAQRAFITEHLSEIEDAIADKLHKAGIKDVVFKDGGQLTDSQLTHLNSDYPKGEARLNFANKSFGDWHSGANGGTFYDVSVVLMGNFDTGHPLSTDLVEMLANVGAHELGHGMGFVPHTTGWSGSDQIYNLFHPDLMNENQGNGGISKPKYFDMTVPQNRHAVETINAQPEYQPR